MNKEHSEELIKKYFNTETSLAEEEILFNNDHNSSEIQAWAKVVHVYRQSASPHLEKSIMSKIKKKQGKQWRLYTSICGIAASLLILATVMITNNNKSIRYAEKEELLNEALSMFQAEAVTSPIQNIIYEDDMIIIYKTSN